MPYARKRRATTKKRTRRPRKMAVPRNIKSIIQKTINRNLETKYASISNTFTMYNSGITAPADTAYILPPVPVGTGQEQRIGSTIRPIKMVIRGYVNYATQNSTLSDARQIGARLFVYKEKSISGYNQYPLSGGNARLLDAGGSALAYTGTAMNFITPKNTDEFHFFADKRFKIMKPWGLTNNFTPSQSNAIASMNSSLWHPFTITLTQKQLPAVLQYEPTNSNSYPVNFAPILALGYSDLLNSGVDTLTTQIGMEWISTLYYKDA